MPLLDCSIAFQDEGWSLGADLSHGGWFLGDCRALVPFGRGRSFQYET